MFFVESMMNKKTYKKFCTNYTIYFFILLNIVLLLIMIPLRLRSVILSYDFFNVKRITQFPLENCTNRLMSYEIKLRLLIFDI